MVESFEPQHRPHSLFYATVVLFDHIIQIAVRSHSKSRGQYAFLLQLSHRSMRGGIAIERDLLEGIPLLDGLSQEPLGRSTIAVCTQEKVDGLPHFIDSTIEIAPLSS